MSFDAAAYDSAYERLFEVVHAARLESERFIAGGEQRSHEDDGNRFRGSICLESPAHFIAIHLRHHDIKQNQIRRRFLDNFESLAPSGGGPDTVL